MNPISRIFVVASFAVALSACADKATPTPEAVKAEGPVVIAPETNMVDSRTTALTADVVAVTLELASAPKMNSEEGVLEIPVKVSNSGKSLLSGEGNQPVNLGVQILGEDGSPGSPGGINDFVRVGLPIIVPGESAVVVVKIPVDARVSGRKLYLDLVQEGVAWFSSFGQPGLQTGPFTICDQALCAEPTTGTN